MVPQTPVSQTAGNSAENAGAIENAPAAPVLTPDQLASLGEGVVAYLKPIRSEELASLFPGAPAVQAGLDLFALLGASGKPLIVTDTREAALASAMQNELRMVSLH